MIINVPEQLSHLRSPGFISPRNLFCQITPRKLTSLNRQRTARPSRTRDPVKNTYGGGISTQSTEDARDLSTEVVKATVTSTTLRNSVWKPARVKVFSFYVLNTGYHSPSWYRAFFRYITVQVRSATCESPL